MKVLKPNKQYHLSSILYRPLLFKKKIQVPSYFAFGKRHLSALHARIRNNCSKNNDLFNYYLCDNPFCGWCNETEEGEHYFFHCKKYRNERHQFFNLNNDLFNNYLYDNPLCSWCNEMEDGEHYFFHCNKYRHERLRHQFFEIPRDLPPLTIDIL